MKQIQSLPPSLRPREKILKTGAETLNVEELLSVVMVTGTKNKSVSTLANKIAKLTKSGTLSKATLIQLGVGPTKTAQILAGIELGRRLTQTDIVTLTSAQQVYLHSQDILHQEKESLLCFYLNARGELLKKELLALGSMNQVNLLPREIFSQIKELPVASIILVHNHPSGILEASPEDILFTKRVKKAAEIIGIKLLDHLIITTSGWVRIKK